LGTRAASPDFHREAIIPRSAGPALNQSFAKQYRAGLCVLFLLKIPIFRESLVQLLSNQASVSGIRYIRIFSFFIGFYPTLIDAALSGLGILISLLSS